MLCSRMPFFFRCFFFVGCSALLLQIRIVDAEAKQLELSSMSPTRPALPLTKSGIEKRLTISEKKKEAKNQKRERVERRQPTELPVKLIAEILKSFIIGDCNTIAQRKQKQRRCEWAFSFSLFKFIFREILLCVVRDFFLFVFFFLLFFFFVLT